MYQSLMQSLAPANAKSEQFFRWFDFVGLVWSLVSSSSVGWNSSLVSSSSLLLSFEFGFELELGFQFMFDFQLGVVKPATMRLVADRVEAPSFNASCINAGLLQSHHRLMMRASCV